MLVEPPNQIMVISLTLQSTFHIFILFVEVNLFNTEP